MSAFVVSTSGINDQRGVNMAFDGLTFTAGAAATVQMNSSQFSATEFFGAPLVFTGNNKTNLVEIFVNTASFNASAISLVSWGTSDRLLIRDTVGNQSMTGSVGNDTFFVTAGADSVNDGGGGADIVMIDWSSIGGNFSMNGGSQFTNFAGTLLNFSGNLSFNILLGAGNDSLTLGAGNDTMAAGDGNDTLNTGLGNATVDGGAGTDLWLADFSNNATAATVDVNLAGVNDAGNGSSYQGIERLGLTGGAGDDVFISAIGNPNDGLNDTLNGGAGNDRLTVGGGVDQVDGGADTDTLIINWAGDLGNFSTNGPSQITDFTNTAVSFSNIERFNLTLGDGNDNVILGTGNDTIRGMGGNDTLNTGQGEAVVDGGTGNDIWRADLSLSGVARDIDLTLTGAANAAGGGTTYRNVEAMNMITGSGDDRLITQTLTLGDNLSGGAGNDTLGVGGGVDVVDGGLGSADLLIVDWSGKTNSASMNGSAQFNDFVANAVSFTEIEHFDVRLGSGNDNIALGGNDDSISGGAGNDVLNTGLGEAVVDGGADTDRWAADLSGQDVARVIDLTLAGTQGAGGGTTYAGIEALTITTGSGDDRLITLTLTLSDNLTGGAGNDTLQVGGGVDNVAGGDGTGDLLIVDWSGKTTSFSMNGGGQFNDFTANAVSFSGIEHFDVRLGSGNDNITLGANDDSLDGGAGNDVLNMGAGEAVVVGGDGTDAWTANLSGLDVARVIDLTLVGPQSAGGSTSYDSIESMNITTGGGDDLLVTRSLILNDVLSAGDGNDTLQVGGGNDNVDGGLGTDDLLIVDWSALTTAFGMNGGSQFNDFTGTSVNFAGIEHFDVRLGSGNDNLTLGALGDTIRGGLGNDTMNGGLGEDWMDWRDATADMVVSVKSGGNGTATGIGNDSFTGFENFWLGAGNDKFGGNNAGNIVDGGLGNDTIRGGGGRNELLGGDGKDRLIGGGGRDFITGGLGDDILEGGLGQNSFIYNDASETGPSAATRDKILGFVAGVDEIDLRPIDAIAGGADDAFVFLGEVAAFTAVGQIRLEQLGTDTLVRLNLDADLASEATILLVGVTAATLTVADFDL